MTITKTGGTWDRTEWPIYFPAVNLSHTEKSYLPFDRLLIAVNEIRNGRDKLDVFIDRMPVFLDSGVYNLTNQHAQKHNLSMDEALSYEPGKIDGFDDLFSEYIALLKAYGDRLWGYIEIDQGGRENKIKTRARIEKLGFNPIPVYHPFNDGWEYFDYLAERYDRICFGNVVMANVDQRKRLIATAWERRRRYPHLWIHALGLTPSGLTTAFPINSCDSSTWISPAKWGQHYAETANENLGEIGLGFIYDYHVDSHEELTGYYKGVSLCAYEAFMANKIVGVIAAEQRERLGADLGLFVGPIE